MKSKKRPKKAVVNPLKVVLVEQGSTIITHIYRSRENFRLDEKARYDKSIGLSKRSQTSTESMVI